MPADIATQILNELIKLLEFEKNFLDTIFKVSIYGFIFFALPIIIGWIIYCLNKDYFIECGKKLEKILINVLKN